MIAKPNYKKAANIMVIGRINEYKNNIFCTQLANQICVYMSRTNVNYEAALRLI